MLKISFLFISLVMFAACSTMASLFDVADDIATDEAVETKIYKNAMQKDTDIKIQVDVINKDPVK